MTPFSQKSPKVWHDAPCHERFEQIECSTIPANDQDTPVWMLLLAQMTSSNICWSCFFDCAPVLCRTSFPA